MLVDSFHNIVFTVLFNLFANVNLHIFYVLIKLSNNKAGKLQGVNGLSVGP